MSTQNAFPVGSTPAQSGPSRRHPRLSVDVSVRVFRNGSFATLGRGHDISTSGMALYTPIELERNQEIQLSFVLPYSRVQFGIKAFVRNRDGFRYGIEFANLSEKELEEIERITKILAMTA
jgi:hypothetical protein